jgi:hypothetical protein
MSEIDILELEVEGGKVHSTRGPSGAHRWIRCLGSTNLIKKLGEKVRTSSLAADEGTAAHTLFANCLLDGSDTWEHSGEKIEVVRTVAGLPVISSFLVGAEMVVHVQRSVDWVRKLVAKLKAEGKNPILLVEQRVASPEDEEAFGTADIVILVPGERIIVPDFKYGKGIVVEPSDEQTRLYGHYAFETFIKYGDLFSNQPMNSAVTLTMDPDTILFPDKNTVAELWILQPRIPHPKGTERRHITNKSELARFFYGEALQAMQDGRKPDAPLCMGDHCRFCPANNNCPALTKEAREVDPTIDPVVLDDTQLGEMIIKLDQLDKLRERCKADAFKRMMAGKKVKHFKIVHKLADRIWKGGVDEETGMTAEQEIVATLGSEQVYTKPTLKSVAQIEAIQGGKTLVKRWGMKPNTGLTMAPESDKRDAVSPDALSDVKNDGSQKEEWEK